MLGKSALVSTIYTCALMLMVLCVVLGAMMVSKATRPYYAMLDTPERLRSGKLDHYLTGEVHSRIFDLIHRAVTEITSAKYDLAEQHIREASELDPGNALFSYMMSALCFKSNDFTRMWRNLKTGNNLGRVRLYASQYVSPESWTHHEVPLLRQMTAVMSRGISTEEELWEFVRMGDALAKCEPADVDTFDSGLAIREIAARRIRKLAELDDNTRLIKLCNRLVDEKHQAYDNYEEVMASVSLRKVSIPTLLMAMASYRRNPQVRESFLINAIERQSEAVTDLRNKILKTPVGSNF